MTDYSTMSDADLLKVVQPPAPDYRAMSDSDLMARVAGQQPQTPSLSAAVTDIPREAFNATADQVKSAAVNLNPFSAERRAAYESGDALTPSLMTGKGLSNLIGLPLAPFQGAARSLFGHPLDVIDSTLHSGATQIYGSDKVPPRLGYEGVKPTADAMFASIAPRGASTVGMTGASPVAPPAPPALEANISAGNVGVDLPRAIATDSPFLRMLGQVSNKMPGGGPMQEGIKNALTQTGEAVGRASDLAGGTADATRAGEGFQAGIENYFKPAIKSKVSAAYDAVDQHINPTVTSPLNETQSAIADIVARRVASGENDPGKAVNTVLGGAVRPGGLTYAGVKDLRTRVGEMLDTGVFPEGMSQAELRRIYGSLSDDLKANVQAAGGQPALDAFNRANSLNTFVAGWKDNIGKILGADRSGEGVTAAILRAASNGPAADLKSLTMARAAVPQTAWQDIASTAVTHLGRDSKGEFSPNIFLNDFARLSDGGKKMLFNGVGSGDVLPYLNDIATVSKKFVDAGKLANTSGTAGHSATFATLGAAAAGALHGSLVEPITAVSTIVGNNLMARALAAPASAASIAKWSRSYQILVQNPTAASRATFNMATRNLVNTLNSTVGSRMQPGDIMRAIQGPAPGAAENDQKH